MSSQKRSSRLCLIAAERDSLKELQMSPKNPDSLKMFSRRKQRSNLDKMSILEEDSVIENLDPRHLFGNSNRCPFGEASNERDSKRRRRQTAEVRYQNWPNTRQSASKMIAQMPKSSHLIQVSEEKPSALRKIKKSLSKSSNWAKDILEGESEVEIEILGSDFEESRVIEISELPFDDYEIDSKMLESDIYNPNMAAQRDLIGVARNSNFVNIRTRGNTKATDRNVPVRALVNRSKGGIRKRGCFDHETIKGQMQPKSSHGKEQVPQRDILNLYHKTLDFNRMIKEDYRSSNSRERTKSGKKRSTPANMFPQLSTPKKLKIQFEELSIEDKMGLGASSRRIDRDEEFQFNLFASDKQQIVQSEIFDLREMKRANLEMTEVVKSMNKIVLGDFRGDFKNLHQRTRNHAATVGRGKVKVTCDISPERKPKVKKGGLKTRHSQNMTINLGGKKVKGKGKSKRKNLSSKKLSKTSKAKKYQTFTPKPKKSSRGLGISLKKTNFGTQKLGQIMRESTKGLKVPKSKQSLSRRSPMKNAKSHQNTKHLVAKKRRKKKGYLNGLRSSESGGFKEKIRSHLRAKNPLPKDKTRRKFDASKASKVSKVSTPNTIGKKGSVMMHHLKRSLVLNPGRKTSQMTAKPKTYTKQNMKTKTRAKKTGAKGNWKRKKKKHQKSEKPTRSSKVSRREMKKRAKQHKRTLTNLEDLELAYLSEQPEFSKTLASNLWKDEMDLEEFKLEASDLSWTAEKKNRKQESLGSHYLAQNGSQNVDLEVRHRQPWEQEMFPDCDIFYKRNVRKSKRKKRGGLDEMGKRQNKADCSGSEMISGLKQLRKGSTVEREEGGKRARHLESLGSNLQKGKGGVKRETPCNRRRKTIQFE